MAPFNGWGQIVSRLKSHYKETVYFLLVSLQELLVLIWSTSGVWKTNTSFHIFINPLELYLSPEIFLNLLLKLCMSPWMGKVLKFVVFRLPENTFLTQKFENGIFLTPWGKTLSQVPIITPDTNLVPPVIERWEGSYVDLHIFVKFSPARAYFNVKYNMEQLNNLWFKYS